MTIHHSYIGCDIAKAMIDVFDPVNGRLSRVANQAAALADPDGNRIDVGERI
ncbi:hypothetical protein [Aminobacter carboxidus]|uniref:Transposase n=1 Tax=Aminobacter carboxidus TaxID=376165 RepID=A0ABR9GXJ5_9HYPH|nr:hypothetical protein [Aminobacter carboxidus]MBE1208408.1 hypothetical protein [Aminobacter carboxidus]